MLERKLIFGTLAVLSCGCSGGGGGDRTNVPASDPVQQVEPRLQLPDSLVTSVMAFTTPDADGDFPTGLITSPTQIGFGPHMQPNTEFAYLLGHDGQTFRAMSGLLPSVTVADQPDSGTITYHATYLLDAIVGIEITGNERRYYTSIGSDNDIDLIADFDAGTLKGRNDQDQFEIDGVLAADGNGVNGSVRWGNTSGVMQGLVGSDRVIGTFHGASETEVYVGGFNGIAVGAE